MEEKRQVLCYTQVYGQEKAKNMVRRSLGSGRVPHAFIFKGPDGVGKRLFGRGLAAALNCRRGKGDACGTCSSCRKFISGNHPDFLLVSPDKGTIKIDQVRAMCRALSYPPYESETRVVLMEDVHTMRQEAANSLLKTLEEPPAGNVLILTAEASQELLTTISSRCQVLPFSSLAENDCVRAMQEADSRIDDRSATILARLAEGSPGRGLLLYRHEMIELLERVVTLLADPALDGSRDVGLLLKTADEIAGLKEQLLPFLGLLRLWLRDLLFADSVGGQGKGLSELGLKDGKARKNWSSEDLFAKLQAIDRAEQELRRNCNRTLVCEVLLFHLH